MKSNRTGFLANVLTLATGTVVAQALTFAAAPVLARVYSPTDYGVLGIFTAIVSVLAVVSTWQYELAIVLPRRDQHAVNTFALSVFLCCGMSLLTLLLTVVLGAPLAGWLRAPYLTPWLWLVPVNLLFIGLYQALNYWSTRSKKFNRLAISRVGQSAVNVATQLALATSAGPGGGLLLGQVIGQGVGTFVLAAQVWKEDRPRLVSAVRTSTMKRVAIKYRQFPRFSTWSGLLNTGAVQLPSVLLGLYFAPAVVGYYALAYRLVATPMNLIGMSIAQVFFPRAAQAQREGVLDKLVLAVFGQLLAIGLTPMLVLSIIGPDLFSVVLGRPWQAAGIYVQWLSPWLLFVFISSPVSQVLSVVGKQREGLWFNIALFCGRALALVVGGMTNSPLIAVALLGVTGTALYMFFCFWLLSVAGVPLGTCVRKFLVELMRTLPYVLAAAGAKLLLSGSLALTAAVLVLGIFALMTVQQIRRQHEQRSLDGFDSEVLW